jgi:hypothetical protein
MGGTYPPHVDNVHVCGRTRQCDVGGERGVELPPSTDGVWWSYEQGGGYIVCLTYRVARLHDAHDLQDDEGEPNQAHPIRVEYDQGG